MANVRDEHKKLSSKIEVFKLLLESKAQSDKVDLNNVQSPYLNQSELKKRLLGEGDGKSVNADFLSILTDLLTQITGAGPDEIKTFVRKIIKKINSASPKITKIIIEELFKALNCETDLSLNGASITFKAEEIDFFDLLKISPIGMPGRVMYEKRDTSVTDYPLPVNKFLHERTVNPGAETFSSINGYDLFDIEFNQFTQEYQVSFKDITITDFVAYYYSSFELFNTKELMSDIIDMLFGIFSVQISTKRVKSLASLNLIMQKISAICGDFYERDSLIKESLFDPNIPENDDFAFDFDDEDTRYIEEQYNLRIKKLYRLVDCNNYESEMNSDFLIDTLLDLDSDDLSDTETLDDFLNNIGSNMDGDSGFDIPTITMSFNKDIFKQIPKTILGKILSPKAIMPFIMLTKIINVGKESYSEVNAFMKGNERFVMRIAKKVYDIYREELYDEIRKRLTVLISTIIKEIAKQQLRGRYVIVLALINAIKTLSENDLTTCSGILRGLLSLLNLKTGVPLGVPFPLLYGSYIREGANSTRAFENSIENLQKLGYNTAALPDGSPNKHVLAMDAQMKGLMQEFAENGAIQFVSQPGTGVHPLGPVAIPYITGKGIILTSF
jgi:hypothetical protein